MSFSGIAKFLIGFVAGVAILAFAGVAAGYYFFTKLTVIPDKHTFPEEIPKEKQVPKVKSSPKTSPKSIITPKPKPSETPATKLEPGAYKARVTWREGLILRQDPSSEANRVRDLPYNQRVIVLKESEDKNWQFIRLEDSNQEGWIRSGNTEKINETEKPEQ
jgi:hypothetical protein